MNCARNPPFCLHKRKIGHLVDMIALIFVERLNVRLSKSGDSRMSNHQHFFLELDQFSERFISELKQAFSDETTDHLPPYESERLDEDAA